MQNVRSPIDNSHRLGKNWAQILSKTSSRSTYLLNVGFSTKRAFRV